MHLKIILYAEVIHLADFLVIKLRTWGQYYTCRRRIQDHTCDFREVLQCIGQICMYKRSKNLGTNQQKSNKNLENYRYLTDRKSVV